MEIDVLVEVRRDAAHPAGRVSAMIGSSSVLNRDRWPVIGARRRELSSAWKGADEGRSGEAGPLVYVPGEIAVVEGALAGSVYDCHPPEAEVRAGPAPAEVRAETALQGIGASARRYLDDLEATGILLGPVEGSLIPQK